MRTPRIICQNRKLKIFNFFKYLIKIMVIKIKMVKEIGINNNTNSKKIKLSPILMPLYLSKLVSNKLNYLIF